MMTLSEHIKQKRKKNGLSQDEEGYHFCYAKEYLTREGATPVSPTMPLTEHQYDKEMMFPVFDGHWPICHSVLMLLMGFSLAFFQLWYVTVSMVISVMSRKDTKKSKGDTEVRTAKPSSQFCPSR